MSGHDELDRRSSTLSPALVDSPLALLGHPVVAALLGISVGVVLLLISRASFRSFTPENPEAGLVFAAVSLAVRMVVAGVALVAYNYFARDGFLPFAIGLAGGFFVLYTIELLKYGKMLSRSR